MIFKIVLYTKSQQHIFKCNDVELCFWVYPFSSLFSPSFSNKICPSFISPQPSFSL
jgi:hypothetical protein